jgi:hypothetical protein
MYGRGRHEETFVTDFVNSLILTALPLPCSSLYCTESIVLLSRVSDSVSITFSRQDPIWILGIRSKIPATLNHLDYKTFRGC